MDWAAKLFGLDPVFHGNSGIGGGIILVCIPVSCDRPHLTRHFQGSASEACLTVAVAARERCLRVLVEDQLTEKATAANGSFEDDFARGIEVKTGVDGARVQASQVVIPEVLRASSTSKMVMYGSTQTHSIGKKVSRRVCGGCTSHSQRHRR
jgi:aromatic-L-amino-acid decarboxylase